MLIEEDGFKSLEIAYKVNEARISLLSYFDWCIGKNEAVSGYGFSPLGAASRFRKCMVQVKMANLMLLSVFIGDDKIEFTLDYTPPCCQINSSKLTKRIQGRRFRQNKIVLWVCARNLMEINKTKFIPWGCARILFHEAYKAGAFVNPNGMTIHLYKTTLW